jgi:hypothetical protein
LELRIRDKNGTLLHARWDEASDAFSLFNDAAGRFDRGMPAGTPARLQTSAAMLHLAEASVTVVNSPLGTGPTSPAVMIHLPVSFKPAAVGRTLYVDVAASDDLGNVDPWVEAGKLVVTAPPH